MLKTFEFSPYTSTTTSFRGFEFYYAYKGSLFLRDVANIEIILTRSRELSTMLRDIPPGQSVMIDKMFITEDIALQIKKCSKDVVAQNWEFTLNRLTGFTAAYAFDNRQHLPALQSSEAIALGLSWDRLDGLKSKLYLSAVSGTEYFYDQFSYWPLICALWKLQHKLTTIDRVMKIAKVKNSEGETLASIVKDVRQFTPNVIQSLEKSFTGSGSPFINIFDTPEPLKSLLGG